jgi:hypothetical protein
MHYPSPHALPRGPRLSAMEAIREKIARRGLHPAPIAMDVVREKRTIDSPRPHLHRVRRPSIRRLHRIRQPWRWSGRSTSSIRRFRHLRRVCRPHRVHRPSVRRLYRVRRPSILSGTATRVP